MADVGSRKEVDKIYDNLQLRLINKRLDKIHKERERAIAEQDNIRDTMSRYSPDPFSRIPRYGNRRPRHLDPLDDRPIIQVPPPIITGPGPAAMPYFPMPPVPLPPPPQQPQPNNHKSEVMEMLMLQGAQMHQAVMQQLMISSLKRPTSQPVSLPPLFPNHATNLPQLPWKESSKEDREPQVPLSFAKDILQGRVTNPRTNHGGWNRPDFPEWFDRGQYPRQFHPTWNKPEWEQGEHSQEKMIPISFARELLSQRPPSVHHHHHHDRDTPDFMSGIHENRFELESRASPSQQNHQKSPPNQTPSRIQKPIDVPPKKRPQGPAECGTQKAEGKAQTTDEGKPKLELPFPGPQALRRFRHAAYVVQACLRLEKSLNRKQNETDFLFMIRIKEIGQAIKRLYLEPDGMLMTLITTLTNEGAPDLTGHLTSGSNKDKKKAFKDIVSAVQDCTEAIVKIMPENGVLGMKNKSALYQLVQEGNRFPPGYLWAQEEFPVSNDTGVLIIRMALLEFDDHRRIKRVDEKIATLLMLGLLVCRGLVLMVLLRPSAIPLANKVMENSKGANNLKMIASILIELTTEVYNYKRDKKNRVERPSEIEGLYSQEDLSAFLKSKNSALEKEEKRLRKWVSEYYKKLSTSDKKR